MTGFKPVYSRVEFNPAWRVPVYLALGAAVALTILVLWLRWWNDEPASPVNVWVPATPSKHVVGVPKVPIAIKPPVKVYPASVKNNLKLPREFLDDPTQHVIESTHVTADDHPHTVTTLINSDTGETQTFDRAEPLPWIAWSNRGGVGMYAGIKNGTPAVRLQAHQELFTVKAIHFGALASVDQPISGPIGKDYFIGVGAEYRW